MRLDLTQKAYFLCKIALCKCLRAFCEIQTLLCHRFAYLHQPSLYDNRRWQAFASESFLQRELQFRLILDRGMSLLFRRCNFLSLVETM